MENRAPSLNYAHTYSTDSADNAAATITLAAAANVQHVLDRIDVAFDISPAAAVLLTISIAGSVVWTMPLTTAGPAPFLFDGDEKYYTGKNEEMIISLAASGTSGRTGYLNTITH